MVVRRKCLKYPITIIVTLLTCAYLGTLTYNNIKFWKHHRLEENFKTRRLRRAPSLTSLPKENRTIADNLEKEVRVLCWVMTCPKYHENRAIHIKNTWGKRCNKLLFMSTQADKSLPTVELPVWEARTHLWSKTKEAFKYIHKYYREDAEWFLKADDDTYVILENLRFLLRDHNTSDPLYFGCRYNSNVHQGYMSGGAGYVLSRKALDRFVSVALTKPEMCFAGLTGAEDVNLGACLENVNVSAMDSRDPLGRGRFFPLDIATHLRPLDSIAEKWYRQISFYPIGEGMNCCSQYTISFHYVLPHKMYELDYLIYNLRPYGIQGVRKSFF